MRKHGRVDANQKPLVAHAQALGASWLDMSSLGDGKPDGILGYHGRDYLVEFKTAKGHLTKDQRMFQALWRGSEVHVVRTEADLEALLLR